MGLSTNLPQVLNLREVLTLTSSCMGLMLISAARALKRSILKISYSPFNGSLESIFIM